MLAVVMPARNEAARIGTVLRQVLRLPVGAVIPVLNGCQDMTAEVVRRVGDKRVHPIQFREALGYDVPRIAGAQRALELGARAVLFVDADLTGPILGGLLALADKVRRGELDLALCDCYAETRIPRGPSTAARVYRQRLAMNQALGREDLGPAIPSHGPSAVSRRLLEQVPLASVGVPPLMQAYACLAGLRVGIAAALPHRSLGSAHRERVHKRRIAETIIGDCLEGTCVAEGVPIDRQGHDGYHGERRFDLVGLEPPS